ncbi:MAG TPA: thiamine phosphate synthase [Gammaproteobacteria bacterium]|nr:thiamine phosphate synthase [Gammaproteobacteria bacterium]HAT27968.1 thiamine phosphate synthase [Gammaproteobacteria bacterium]
MQLSGIYAITDDNLLPEPTRLEAVAAALGAGISLLQFRSKSGTRASRLKAAIELLVLCRAHHVPLIINDDVDLCLAADADGVHLGQRDAALESARTRLGPAAIIGVTCHSSVDSAVEAQLAGADYVAFGRFFDSATKPEAPPAQLEILGQAKAALSIPIVAIGGINAENGADVLAAGADMLAVIDAIFGDDQQVRQRTGALVRISKQSQRSKPGL